MSGITYMNDARAEQRDLTRQAEIAVAEAALGRDSAARASDGWTFTFDAAGTITGREAARAFADHSGLARMFERAAAAHPPGSWLTRAKAWSRFAPKAAAGSAW